MSLRALLLLVPLLVAGCATAAPPAAAPDDADTGAVRFARVTGNSVEVHLPTAAHAVILDVRPRSLLVARWLDGQGTRPLSAGSHRLALSERIPRPRDEASRACNRPGEFATYDAEMARMVGGGAGTREVVVRGTYVYCISMRNEDVAERTVLVVVAPQPISDGLVEEVVTDVNRRYAGLDMDGATLSRVLTDALAAEWPGSTGYFVRVPRS